MVKIQGTPCMRSHIFVHRATTKYFSNLFVFKSEIEKEGLLSDSPADLGAGGPRFKSGRPDQSFLRPTAISKNSFPSLWGKFRGPYCNIPSFSASCCSSCIRTTASFIFTARYY